MAFALYEGYIYQIYTYVSQEGWEWEKERAVKLQVNLWCMRIYVIDQLMQLSSFSKFCSSGHDLTRDNAIDKMIKKKMT